MTDKELSVGDEQVLRIAKEVGYAHESQEEQQCVIDFARRLRAEWMAQQEPFRYKFRDRAAIDAFLASEKVAASVGRRITFQDLTA